MTADINDMTQLEPLLAAFPAIRGCVGRPRRKPGAVQGGRGYHSQPHRGRLQARGIVPILARRRTPPGGGLGRTRWVVESTLAWLHRYRRLTVCYERLAAVHEAFLKLGCALICWNFFKPLVEF